jgi:phosphonate metabolism protein PhnN/1,5-bisphosphokinase (PRPP-forming)
MSARASICPRSAPGRGTLYLIVGPSGAGKDSLIAAARTILGPRGTHIFPQRVITRAADAGGEDHIHVTPSDFAATAASGGFALAWGAHGLNYGISMEIESDLSSGRHVVANVSRTVLETARANHAPVRVLYVTAPTAVLAKRLTARGRESAADVTARLERAGTTPPAGSDVTVLNNDRSLEAAVADFLAALTD